MNRIKRHVLSLIVVLVLVAIPTLVVFAKELGQLDISGQVLEAGDALVVPAGSPIAVGNPGDEPAVAHIAIAAGFEATMADGSKLSPPWAQ